VTFLLFKKTFLLVFSLVLLYLEAEALKGRLVDLFSYVSVDCLGFENCSLVCF